MDEPDGYRPPSGLPPPVTAQEKSERWILAALLSEPHLWAGLIGVDVTDFTDPARRLLAEVYWQHQRDEGEPAFNEFLDVLRAASPPEVDLATLAVELLGDLERARY